MSRENVEMVRGTYAEWERGNMKAGIEMFDPEIAFETFMPDSKERVAACGPEGVEAFMREFLAQWRDFKLIGKEFRAVGDDVVFVAGQQSATGRQSGATVDQPAFSIWTFRGGKVVTLVIDVDRQRALEAAGLSE